MVMPLVSDEQEAIENIGLYARLVESRSRNKPLRPTAMIPYVQAWYATPDGKGGYHYGPSKFIGYADITGALYEEHHVALDGRLTESQLAKWAEPIRPGHPLYKEIHRGLARFCARHGGHINGRARIALLRSHDDPGPPDSDAMVEAALLLLVSRLPAVARRRIRRQIPA